MRTLRPWGLILLMIALGCGDLGELPTDPGPPIDPPDPSATFSRVQREIFTPTCAVAGCHDRFGRSENLLLAQGEAYGNLVGVPSTQIPLTPRVTPNDPERSYLYRKVTGASGILGTRMPQAGPNLSEAHLKLIRDWIRRGAPND